MSLQLKIKTAWWFVPLIKTYQYLRTDKPLYLFANLNVFTFYWSGKRGSSMKLRQILKKKS